MENGISLADVQSVEIDIRDLRVEVDFSSSLLQPSAYVDLYRNIFHDQPTSSKKVLLDLISCSFKPGTLTAIIGGSGSGKTTLLNAISQRSSNSKILQSGSIRYNGAEDFENIQHAYVMQQDMLLPSLTVRETLRYSADLRLPTAMDQAQRRRVVEEVILELGLKDCANTRIGNSSRRGCSGGEKRRTSIGVQLLGNPSVLFLDEPTTGLDATTAFQLVKTMKTLANKNRTVITTVHQPRSETWSYFDNLIILSKGGRLIYSGPSAKCIPWFKSLDYELPAFVNPFDFFADLAAIDNRNPQLEHESSVRVDSLRESWRKCGDSNFISTKEELPKDLAHIAKASIREKYVKPIRQIYVLTLRTFVTTYREPMGMAASIMEAVLMGIICGYIFFHVPKTLSGIKSRQGSLYAVGGLQGYLFLIFETYRLTVDMPGFDRENKEGCVDVLPFLISRRLARLLTEDLPVPIIFSLIFFFMVGFDIEKFPIFFVIVLLNHFIAVTCAQTCVATIRHFAGASLLANSVYTLQTLAAGYFIQSNSIPIYLRWSKYITYNYYVFTGFCHNEFEGSFYACPNPAGESSAACAQYTGRYILDSLGIPDNWTYQPILAELAFVAFFSLLNVIGLTVLKVNITSVKYRTSHVDQSVNATRTEAKLEQVNPLSVNLENFSLDVEQRKIRGSTKKCILRPISANFQPGMINAVLGPSGSGKTSLLNSIALRLRSRESAMTRYKTSGKVTFNGAVASDRVVRSICSYVAQDDDALFPSLTVRESLKFAANLRLPSWMSKADKVRRAEEIMLKLGLKDCADTQIGSEVPPVKGISGGEKRRTTIATQILTNPNVLLLDEPTSGLDAFTANSIMEVLQGLAAEGRTIIMTIHQARSDIFFNYFGNILLLARGGAPVYYGNSVDMLGHFSTLGYDCPEHVNPADFALDLITIDLQETQRETVTRKRVSQLIKSWESQTCQLKKMENNLRNSTGSTTNKLSVGTSMLSLPESMLDKSPLIVPMSNKHSISAPAELGAFHREPNSLLKVLPTLLHRSFINFRRQPPLLIARTMQVMGLAILLALFLAPLGTDYSSIQNRIGFIQNISAFYFIGVLQNLAVYPAERDVFYLENDDGIYGVEAFLLSYTLLEVPFEIVTCLLAGVFAVFAVGLPHNATVFFVYSFSCFVIVCCGESLGIVFNTVFANHSGFAINFPTVIVAIAQVLAGSMSINMPSFLKKMNFMSPCRYSVRVVAHYGLQPNTFTCDDTHKLPNGDCMISTGKQVLDLYDLNGSAILNLVLLGMLVVVYRLLGWLSLQLVRMNRNR